MSSEAGPGAAADADPPVRVDDEQRSRARAVLVEVGREVTHAIKTDDRRLADLLADERELAIEIKRRFGY